MQVVICKLRSRRTQQQQQQHNAANELERRTPELETLLCLQDSGKLVTHQSPLETVA